MQEKVKSFLVKMQSDGSNQGLVRSKSTLSFFTSSSEAPSSLSNTSNASSESASTKCHSALFLALLDFLLWSSKSESSIVVSVPVEKSLNVTFTWNRITISS